MLEQLKRLGGDSLLYALMTVGTKLIAFFMLPVYILYLGAEEIGVMENIDALTSMLTFVVIFGTDSALAFYYFDTKDEALKKRHVQHVLMFRLLVSCLLLLIGVIAGKLLSNIILGTDKYVELIHIAFIVLVLESIITLVLTYFRYEFFTKKVVFYTVLKLALAALLSFLFLKYWMAEVNVVYYARALGAILIIIFVLPYIKRFITFKIDMKLMKEILAYAAPLVPASTAFWVISSSNRFFLSHYETLAHVGIYGVAVKFATVITLLTSSFQMAWRPYTMSIKERPDAKNIFAKVYIIVLAGGMLGLLGIATFIPYILRWMIGNPDFYEASHYITVLSLGTFLNFYYLIISVGLFIKKETKTISVYFGIAAVISIVLNIILIPLLSIWGAVLAVVISYLFACIVIFIKSQSVYRVPVSIKKLLLLFITGVISMLSIVYIQEYSTLNTFYIIIPWLFYLAIVGVTVIPRKY